MKILSVFLSIFTLFSFSQVSITNAFSIPAYKIFKLTYDSNGMIYVISGSEFNFNAPTKVIRTCDLRKYTPSGQLVWQKTMKGNNLSVVNMYMKSDQLVFAGEFADTLFLPGQQIISSGGHDIYLTKINSNGLMVTTKQGGSGDEHITGFTVDDNLNLYVAGTWSGQVSFAGYQAIINSPQQYIAKTNPAMNQINWLRIGVSLSGYEPIIRSLRIFNQKVYGRCIETVILSPVDTIGTRYYGDDDGFIISMNGQLLGFSSEYSYYNGSSTTIVGGDSNGNLFWYNTSKFLNKIACVNGTSTLWALSHPCHMSFLRQGPQMQVAAGPDYNDSLKIIIGTIAPPTSSVAQLTNTFIISSPSYQSKAELSPYVFRQTIVYGHFSKNVHLPGITLTGSDSTITAYIAIVNWDGTAGLKQNNVMNLSMYPNPTNGIINLECAAKAKISIYNMLGNCIYKSEVLPGISKIDISHFPEGIYMVEYHDNYFTSVRKIIKD
jgi:hypothetical protein